MRWAWRRRKKLLRVFNLVSKLTDERRRADGLKSGLLLRGTPLPYLSTTLTPSASGSSLIAPEIPS